MKKFVLVLACFTICYACHAQRRSNTIKKKPTIVVNSSSAATNANSDELMKKQEKLQQDSIREIKNATCYFDFSKGTFISGQNPENDFIVYEIPDMKASDLKAAAYTTLSTMYKSPKDVITNLSDNMLQLEGYASGVYLTKVGDNYYNHDLVFDIVIQFKDGKIRYNVPTIKMIYMEWPLPGMAKMDMTKPLSELISEDTSRALVQGYFTKLINSINTNLKKSNEW